jgi:hypothetical protein
MRINKEIRGEREMAELTFRCPTSGTDIETGIETDADTRSQIRLFRLRILCPACGQTHEFGISEASAQDNSIGLSKTITPYSPHRRRVHFKPRWQLS